MKLMSRFIYYSKLTQSENENSKFRFIVFLCYVFVLSFFLNTAQSADQDKNTTDSGSAATNSEVFEYKLENRPDPFVPFITEKAASSNVNMDEIVDRGEPLTGMQLFEPGQLTLVALLKKSGENIAMVQDFTGKGYVLTDGTKIGRRGVVKSFTAQSVIIEETAVTRAGKKTVTEIVMLLKKEGEK